jgi:uncharacterized protein (TIGR03790 family)
VVCSVVLFGVTPEGVFAGGGPENVLVVANLESEDSIRVADYYVQRRGIPLHQRVTVSIPVKRKRALWFDSYEEYDELLQKPVREWLESHPLAPITLILLTRDIPVTVPLRGKGLPVPRPKDPKKMKEIPHYRSVTHMLALHRFDADVIREASMSQMIRNPMFQADRTLNPRSFKLPNGNPFPAYGVGLLNAFTVDDVLAMIDRSVEADRQVEPFTSTIYLGRSKENDPRGCYNGYFPVLKGFLQEKGFRIEIVEHPGKSRELLVDREDVLIYQYGQASWSKEFPAKNRYRPGALIDNLTSAALTSDCFNPERKGGQTSMCRFLAAGATAVHGCVREPYTSAFNSQYAHIVFYLGGYNLVESYFMAHPILPWMNLVAGDPLLQPFAKRPVVKVEVLEEGEGVRLKVQAQSTRSGCGVERLILYRNGHSAGVLSGGSGEFNVPSLDRSLESLAVVAVGDSKYGTQGRWELRPPPVEGARTVPVRWIGRSGTRVTLGFEGKGGNWRVQWSAPGASRPSGVTCESTLDLDYRNGSFGRFDAYFLDVEDNPIQHFDLGKMVAESLLRESKKQVAEAQFDSVVETVLLLERCPLDRPQKRYLSDLKRDVDSYAVKRWGRLKSTLKPSISTKDLSRVESFGKRYADYSVGKDVGRTIETFRTEIDAKAQPAFEEAQRLENSKLWVRSLEEYSRILKRWPSTRFAERIRERVTAIQTSPEIQVVLEKNRLEKEAEKLYRLAEMAKRNGRLDMARSYLDRLISRCPGTEYARKALKARNSWR